VPLLFLLRQSLHRATVTMDGALWRDALNSVTFAALATLVALGLGLATILATRWRPGSWRAVASNIAQTGYALPGLVLALGLLTPVLAIDNALNALAAWLGLTLPGLVLMGSGTAVDGLCDPLPCGADGLPARGLRAHPFDYDDSARSAGAGQITAMRRIHLPLLRPALLGAAIVVFVDCLKELPATLLLRPLNVETLATSIYQYASRGSFEDGSLAALLIVAASIGPVAWLTRFSDMPKGPV
jgi:iron(III) transport system permease protein